MIPNILGYALNDALKILDSMDYKYEIKEYISPKFDKYQDADLETRVVKIIEKEDNKLKLIVSNF